MTDFRTYVLSLSKRRKHSMTALVFCNIAWTTTLATIAHGRFTTGIASFAECQELCRVFYIGHSAKDVFAECPNSNTRQRHDPRQSWSLPSAQDRHSTKTFSLPSAQICHSAKTFFAECQRLTLGKFWPTVKPACRRQLFAECTNATLGKEALCRVPKADTRQSIIFFDSCTSKIFTSPHTTCGTPCLSLVYF